MSTSDHERIMADIGRLARTAARRLAMTSTAERNHGLTAAAAEVRDRAESILEANARDLARARQGGLAHAMLDRLVLNEERIASIADGLDRVVELPDPIGRDMGRWQRPNGLDIARVAVPIGVIGVIYESRPNVTADAAALCLKAGNATILRGGSEAIDSNRALLDAILTGLDRTGLPRATVQMLPDQDHALVGELLRAHAWVDVIVPRGGRRLVERVQRDARVPVFAHLDGNNHLYLHPSADADLAREVIVNAKMRRPGICGALETLLIDEACLDQLPALVDALTERGCTLHGDDAARTRDGRIQEATEADWRTEYLDAILAIRTVDSLDAAVEHIAEYGSGHTDGILAGDQAAAEEFLDRVDSAIVVHNASTQFADGGEFGFGAEIGIATGRLHARGPVGLEQLTTFKYLVRGTGQIRP